MRTSDKGKFTYQDFVQKVRHYRTSDVIRALASIPTDHFQPGTPMSKWRAVNPWATSAIAREALICGNEHRAPHDLSISEIEELFLAFSWAYDEGEDASGDVALNIITRHAYEQFSSQESVFEELSRAAILFQGGIDGDHKIVCDEVERALGFKIEDAISAAIVIFGSTSNSPWCWNPETLFEENLNGLFDFVSKETIIKFGEMLTCDQNGFREEYVKAMPNSRQGKHLITNRWGFNPVSIYPLIRIVSGEVLAVQRWLIPRRLSPQFLYYDAIDKGDQAFTSALGNVVETYIGKLLGSVHGAHLFAKFKYYEKKEELESIDWFLELPSCIVYVESKSARLTLSARMADESLVSNLKRDLGKAFKQLNNTYEVIHGDLEKYSGYSLGKPIIGLVVTPEPIYSGNSRELRKYLPDTKMNILVASLRDLEGMTTLPAQDLGDQLMEIANDPEKSTWVLSSALKRGEPKTSNPILEQAARLLPIFRWNPVTGNGLEST